MARNGSGTYTNPYPNFVSGTVISSTEVDTNNSQIATALTQSIAVDGQSVVTADLPLATHKFTGMKVGTAATDSLSLGQAQAEAFVWCGTAGGSADAITLTPSPPITAYAAGQRFVWMASGLTNTTATTVAISGLAAIALQDNGAALTAGQHAASKMFMGILNTTSTMQIMQVQVSGTDPLIVSSLTVTGDATIDDDLIVKDDLTLLSDSAILGFGADTDVTLVHNADLGLTLSAGSAATQLTITSTDAGASAAPTVALVRNSASPAAADQLGHINFTGEDAGSNATAYGQIIGNIVDPSSGSEYGNIKFYAITNGSSVMALEVRGESATFNGDVITGDDVILDNDGGVVSFGDDQDVFLSHIHNSGLTLKNTSTGDDTPILLLMQTGETDIAADDMLGRIQFQAPDEASGTDAILVAAEIAAVSEGDFSATSNATKLSFKTGASEAASEKMSLSSGGNLTVSGTIAGTLATAAQTNITSLGTLSSLAVTTTSTGNSIAVTQQGTGQGVYAQVNDGIAPGTYGYQNSSDTGSIAARGYAVAGFGVYGSTGNASYAGVAGFASVTSHYAYLGYGTIGCYATSVTCIGALSKGSGTFRIPHGLREDYDLCHSFIEGPQCDLIYRGRVNLVNGRATVSMDTKYGMTAGTFAWLTKDIQTFTSNETGWDAVKSSFSGDTITIECQNTSSTDTISWMVVAERDDPNIKSSSITDSNGDLIIERPSEPAPPPPSPL